MPDGRFLSKSIAWSDQVGGVSLEADFLFMRMIPHLDRDGRISGVPKALKGMCCPLRDEMTPDIIEGALGELAAAKLIVWYQVDGTRYVEFPGFASHQRGARLEREAPSRIPPSSTASAEVVRTNSGPTPPKVRVSEVKGSEAKSSEVKSAAPSAAAEATPNVFRLAPFLESWREKFGGDPPAARFGKVFKRLVVAKGYGEAEVLRRWLNCLAAKGDFATPEELAAKWDRYAVGPARPTESPLPNAVDGWYGGNLDELTRPAGVRPWKSA